MNQMTLQYTLARTNNPQTSKDAAKKMVDSGALSRQEKNVYEAILMWTKHCNTFTPKDIATCVSWCNYWEAYDICRKRFSGLFNKFKIVFTGEQRDGCRVWRLL